MREVFSTEVMGKKIDIKNMDPGTIERKAQGS